MLTWQGWEKVCSTKKMNRFHPPEVKQGLQQLDVAKEHLQAAALAAWEAFLGEFALHYAPFRAAVMALASLDALHSLATLACNPGYALPPPPPPPIFITIPDQVVSSYPWRQLLHTT